MKFKLKTKLAALSDLQANANSLAMSRPSTPSNSAKGVGIFNVQQDNARSDRSHRSSLSGSAPRRPTRNSTSGAPSSVSTLGFSSDFSRLSDIAACNDERMKSSRTNETADYGEIGSWSRRSSTATVGLSDTSSDSELEAPDTWHSANRKARRSSQILHSQSAMGLVHSPSPRPRGKELLRIFRELQMEKSPFEEEIQHEANITALLKGQELFDAPRRVFQLDEDRRPSPLEHRVNSAISSDAEDVDPNQLLPSGALKRKTTMEDISSEFVKRQTVSPRSVSPFTRRGTKRATLQQMHDASDVLNSMSLGE